MIALGGRHRKPPPVKDRVHWRGPRYCYPGNPWPDRYTWTTDTSQVTCGKCRRTRAFKAAS